MLFVLVLLGRATTTLPAVDAPPAEDAPPAVDAPPAKDAPSTPETDAGLRPSALGGDAEERTPLEIFEDRILPIFRSEKPSSCVQCHLAAVDLKDYILPSQEKTFASLRAQGLIDVEQPAKSKILGLIAMGEKDSDEGAKRIHERTRRAELEAFKAWIEACSKDPAFRNLPDPEPEDTAKPDRPDSVIRHARKSRLVDSFARNVWSQRMRCFPCHTPHEIDENNPKHARAIERVADLEEKLGPEAAKRLRIFGKTPEATLDHLIEASRATARRPGDSPPRLPLIHVENPRQSLLLLKPTSRVPKIVGGKRVPSSVEPVSHMGGLKMHVGDASYKALLAWLEDYAKVTKNEYRSVDELPADNWIPTRRFVRLDNTPKDWPKLTRVQIFVHAPSTEEGTEPGRFTRDPVAFTQGLVTPRRRVVGPLFELDSAGDDGRGPASERKLEPGRYLVKVYVDSRGKLDDDPTAMLDAEDFHGETVIEAHWRELFRAAEVVSAESLETPERPRKSSKIEPSAG